MRAREAVALLENYDIDGIITDYRLRDQTIDGLLVQPTNPN